MSAEKPNWKLVYVQIAEALGSYMNLDDRCQELVAASLTKEHSRLMSSLSFRMKTIEEDVNKFRSTK